MDSFAGFFQLILDVKSVFSSDPTALEPQQLAGQDMEQRSMQLKDV